MLLHHRALLLYALLGCLLALAACSNTPSSPERTRATPPLLPTASTIPPLAPTPNHAAAQAASTATARTALLTPLAILQSTDTATLSGWKLSTARFESRARLGPTAVGDYVTPEGWFWLIWLDARNTGPQPQTLADAFTFRLVDDQGQAVEELNTDYPQRAALAAQRENRDLLTLAVVPDTLTHSLLVFDIAGGHIPRQLVIVAKDPPAHILINVADTVRAAAQRTITALAQTERKAATATVVAANKTATAEAKAACPSGTRYGAKCRDGSNSSATGSGACSHHGGVAQWLICP